MSTWVDFRSLRDQLSFDEILRHYKVEIKVKGRQHHGFCPIPSHQGKRNSPSFSANLERGVFQCFGCGAKGNILEFCALMENVNPSSTKDFHALAVRLQDRFRVAAQIERKPDRNSLPQKPDPQGPVVINSPLDFELKGLEPTHEYLRNRGFSEATVRLFGLGFCSRGILKDRIAIPVRDAANNLVGYAGRLVDDRQISDENPRYRFPGKRERQGTVFEFRKSLLLYNASRLNGLVDDLIVVEGFASVWWLTQNGLPHVVATMGVDCSKEQADQIVNLVRPTGRVWIMPDGDAAGNRLAESLLRQVSPSRLIRWAKLEIDRQPTDLVPEELKSRFAL